MIWRDLKSFILMACFCAMTSACSGQPPPIASGLNTNWDPHGIEFDNRLKQKFPVGSDTKFLIQELLEQGFKTDAKIDHPDGEGFTALYEMRDIACRQSWIVSWSSSSGKITSVSGHSRQICL